MGMMVDMARIDNSANNLANADSVGYKKDNQVFSSYLKQEIMRIEAEKTQRKEEYIGSFETGVVLDSVYPVLDQGAFEETGNQSDFYINGEGFFEVQNDAGDVYFTRNGSFTVNQDGNLVDFSGNYILNNIGERITFDRNTVIDENGNIYENDVISGRIGIFKFDDENNLEKSGNNLFRFTGDIAQIIEDFDSKLVQGGYEKSNVDSLREMVNLIDAQRHFEICQRVVTTEDDLLNASVNKVATLR